jgi:hypothetical protein
MTVFGVEDGRLVGDNGRLRVEFDGSTGGICRLVNCATGQVIVDNAGPAPWRMRAQGTRSPWYADGIHVQPPPSMVRHPAPASFDFTIADDSTSATLHWTSSDTGIWVEVRASLQPSGDLELWPTVSVEAKTIPPEAFTYPILASPRPLSLDGTNDSLLFPGQAGWLMHRPLQGPPRECMYPDGYAGAPVQLLAYFEQGRGGFYVAAHDPYSTYKLLRFSAEELSIDHDAWDVRRGSGLDLGYPVVIAPLQIGDWHEAADRYRTWALAEAPWTGGSRRVDERAEKAGARWIYEEVGLSIWGAPSSLDWSPWYRRYAEIAGTPLHVVAGWDWPQVLPPSLGEEGCFPAKFHANNVSAWQGHYVTPYLNDLWVSSRAPDFLERWEPNLLLPYTTFPWAPFSEPSGRWVDGEAEGPSNAWTITNDDYFLCPATQAQSDLHAWRDVTLARDYELPGVFYDISSGNPGGWCRCLRSAHGHPPGRGRQIIEAYDAVNRHSKEVVAAETGRYWVQGTETIVENVIGAIDFYVSRTCAGPLGLLETWIIGPEDQPGGDLELIPLFQAVYHDVGPVYEDGWITLGRDEGDLFFWIAARIALQWGGVLSLQYGTVPPERYEGCDLPAETVLWDGALHRFDLPHPEPDQAKLAFVADIAAARTTYGKDYLAYGKLLRPLPHEADTIELAYDQLMSYGWGSEGLVNEGRWAVPEVLHAAWEYDGRVGLFFVNLRGDEDVRLCVATDAGTLWDLDLAGAPMVVRTAAGAEELGAVTSSNEIALDLALAPRLVTLVEIGTGQATR